MRVGDFAVDDRATMVTTDTDHSSTQSASGPVDLSWTYLLIFFITVLVMCCLIIVGFSVVVLLHVVRRRVKISLRRIGNVDGKFSLKVSHKCRNM